MFQTAPQAQTVTVIPGDGVSPELVRAMRDVFCGCGIDLMFQTAPQAQTVTVIPGDGVSPELTAPQAQTVTVIPGDGVSPELTAPQAQTVTVIPGDGVSPELVRAMRDVFRDCGIPVQFEEVFVSEIDPDRSASVDDLVASVKKNNGICIKGVTQSVFRTESGELQSTNTKMRRALDLFANVVHVKSIPGLETRHTGHDFYVIREQTEGEYSAIEHESVPGVVESLKIVTRDKCTRIAKFAFNFATKHGRKRVTAVHKANIMKLGDGLFLRCCDEVSKLYPKIEFSNMIIDNCCMQLVSRPQQFDVMVMGNLYGNIVDNLAAGLVGGAGVVPGMSFGMDTVIFEQGARHTFQASIGLDRANPTAMLLCAANMIEIVSEETKAWEIIALFVTYLLLN